MYRYVKTTARTSRKFEEQDFNLVNALFFNFLIKLTLESNISPNIFDLAFKRDSTLN